MYRVTRSYRVTPRSTKECNSCGLERRFDDEDEYILRIYLCTCASYARSYSLEQDVSVRTSPVRAFTTRDTSYPPRRVETRVVNERRARAYYCLRYAFHRCLNASFLSRHDDGRKIRENGYRCLSRRLRVLTFSETPRCLFRKYFSLLFRFICYSGRDRKKKRNSRSEEDRE